MLSINRFVYFLALITVTLSQAIANNLSPHSVKEFFKPKSNDSYIGVSPSTAKVVIIEYGSLTCYHCRHFFLNLMPQIKERFISKQNASLSIVYRNFVADGPSLTIETLIRCLNIQGNKKHEIIANLYQTQSDWAFSGNSYNKIKSVFVSHGYKYNTIDSCMQNKELIEKIMDEQRDVMQKGGLIGTPMIIINGVPLVDIRPSAVLSQVELELKRTA